MWRQNSERTERAWFYNSGNGRTYAEAGSSHLGWVEAEYAYNGGQPHAVTSVTRDSVTDTYVYDGNGNPSTPARSALPGRVSSGRRMTCRVEAGEIFNQVYNAENRIATLQKLDQGSRCPGPNISAAVEDILG